MLDTYADTRRRLFRNNLEMRRLAEGILANLRITTSKETGIYIGKVGVVSKPSLESDDMYQLAVTISSLDSDYYPLEYSELFIRLVGTKDFLKGEGWFLGRTLFKNLAQGEYESKIEWPD